MDAVLQRLRPDLLILDLMLPGEDGLSICRRLRADGQHSDPDADGQERRDRSRGRAGDGRRRLSAKPFGPRELLARVRAILRRAQGGTAQAG